MWHMILQHPPVQRSYNFATWKQFGVALWKLVPPLMVHDMGPCFHDGYGLPYVSLNGVTVSTGEFHLLPVYGVVIFDNVCDLW